MLGAVGLALINNCGATPHLTGLTVFSLNDFTIYDGVNGWDTVPTNPVANVWVSGTSNDNGPSDAEARVDILLPPGSGIALINCAPGDILQPYHAINLYFNNSTVPQISGYQPTACAAGPPTVYSGPSLGLAAPVAAAGTLQAVVDGYEILLEGFLLSMPSCGNTDGCSPFSKFPDGTNDFSGAFLLTVKPLPGLFITRTTTNTVAVWWPSPSTGWVLQQNTNSVASVNWSNVTDTIQDDGTTKTLIVNPPAGNRFYRLFKP